jgi:hypothetical protein
VFLQQSGAVSSHVAVLAVRIESRADVFCAAGGMLGFVLFVLLYNWRTTGDFKGGYPRFVNWTSAQRAEARQYQAERRRRPSPVAVETSRQAKLWWKTGWAFGAVGFAFGSWAIMTSTPFLTWTAFAIFGVLSFASLPLFTIGLYLEFKALKQQRHYDELQAAPSSEHAGLSHEAWE